MFVYVIMLVCALLCFCLELNDYRTVTLPDNSVEKRSKLIYPFIVLSVICLFAACRGEIGDTGAYISTYYNAPNDFSQFVDYVKSIESDKLFYGYMCFIRCLFPNSTATIWLSSVSIICCLLLLIGLYNTAECSSFVLFIFIASSDVLWLMNGMRQFTAVCIIFSAAGLIKKRKWLRFFIVVGIAYFVHDSALLMIPFYLIAIMKPWSKMIWIFIAASVVVILNSDSFFNTMDTVMTDSNYSNSLTFIKSDSGSNIFRALVSTVPVGIAFIKRKEVEAQGNPFINVCVNMSLLTSIMFFLASFSSGIVVGRVPAYFELFAFILLQWLIGNVFDKDKRVLMYVLCIFFYSVYFYYAYNGIGYYSSILNIYYKA